MIVIIVALAFMGRCQRAFGVKLNQNMADLPVHQITTQPANA